MPVSKSIDLAQNKLDQQVNVHVSYDAYGKIMNYNVQTNDSTNLITNFSHKDNMRRFLLGSLTVGSMMLYGARNSKAAPDACTTLGGVYTCQGDQSAGITYNTTGVLTTLNVNNLTQNSGAIYASEATDLIITVDTGVFTINSANTGIDGRSTSRKLTIDSTGDITSTGDHGIRAQGDNVYGVSVTNDGDIQSLNNGILARSAIGGAIVDNTGDITSTGNRGIIAFTYGLQEVSVTNLGTIISQNQGIDAFSRSGKVTVDSTGDITSFQDKGIYAGNESTDEVDILNNGTIQADKEGIKASSSDGKITINSTGDITSVTEEGIQAENGGFEEIIINNNGAIQANGRGIIASSYYGKITINSTGDITSDTEQGIFAQNNANEEISVTSNGTIQSMTQGIYARSDLGKVTVDNTGDITTTTNEGIYARSFGNEEVLVMSNGTIESAEHGIRAVNITGKVTVNSTGDITSTNANGIYAKSFGTAETLITSDGKIQADTQGIYANNATGNVTITSTGDVTSTTDDGIFITSAGDKIVQVLGGTINGMDDGINFAGTGIGTLNNSGTLLGGDNAIEGDTGDETVNNFGTVTGNVNLGTGTNIFNNNATGIFNSGMTVNLGGGTLQNAGSFSPGDINNVQTTTLTGNLVQTSTGQLVVDIDEGGAGIDFVTISGTANFAGQVTANIINLTSTTGSFAIADATGGVTLSTSDVTLTNSSVVPQFTNFGLRVIGNELHLTFQPVVILDLLTQPLTPNQLATALNLDSILRNGGASPALQGLLDTLRQQSSEAAIREALDQLHSESYLSNLPTTLFSNLDFAHSMLSCPQYESDNNSHLKEGQCFWAKVSTHKFNQDRTHNNIGIDENLTKFSGGIQGEISPNWHLGFAASYEDSKTKIDNRARHDGYRAQFGSVLKTRIGDTKISAGLTGGFGSFDTKRFITFGGLNLTAEGNQDIGFGSGHLQISHSFDMGNWYMRPIAQANLTYLHLDGLTETGGGPANLTLQDVDDWYLSFSPAIEFGTEINHTSGAIIRPYFRAGLTYFENNEISVSTSFNGAPAGISTFQISSEFDELFGTAELGLDIISDSGLNLKINYEGLFGADSEVHSGGVKLGVKF